MLIETKLYGVCKVIKQISPRYYQLKTLDKNFFYPQGKIFNIYLSDEEYKPKSYIEIKLF